MSLETNNNEIYESVKATLGAINFAQGKPKKQPQYHTPEGLERIRRAAYQNQPWRYSTGPKSDLGKSISSKNALKHGLYSQIMKEHDRQRRRTIPD